MAAEVGNKYAAKDITADSHLHIRIRHQLKEQAREYCESLDISLSEYVVRLIKADMGVK